MVCCKDCIHFETVYQWCGNDYVFGACNVDNMVFFQDNFDILTEGQCDLYVQVDANDTKRSSNKA